MTPDPDAPIPEPPRSSKPPPPPDPTRSSDAALGPTPMSARPPMGEADTLPENFWPAHHRPPLEESVFAHCPWCDRDWQIDKELEGYKLRCHCNAWLIIPRSPAAPTPDDPALLGAPGEAGAPGGSQLTTRNRDRQVAFPEMGAGLPLTPVEPDPKETEEFGIQLQPYRERRRAGNRGALEIIAIMTAFLLPGLAASWFFPEQEPAVLFTVSGFVTGLVVIGLSVLSPEVTFGAVRGFSLRHGIESVVVAGITAAIAIAYTATLREYLPAGESEPDFLDGISLPVMLFAFAAIPAVFEELAFRGLVHTRAVQLFGKIPGWLIAAGAFGIAHGMTPGLPFQLGLGVYLGSLRERCGSLVPCMITHFLYNGTLLVNETL